MTEKKLDEANKLFEEINKLQKILNTDSIEIKMKEKENIQETIQHLGELCYDNGITENDIWNFIRDKKSKEDFLWTD